MTTKSLMEQKATVKLKETGTSWRMGYEHRFEFRDVLAAMRILWKYNVHQEVAKGVDIQVLLGSNKQAIHALVPMILRTAERAIDDGVLEWPLRPALETALYVFAWYWHQHLDGPKPIPLYKTRRRTPNYGVTFPIGCPFCGKEATLPKNVRTGSAKWRSFIRWLLKHGVQYHKWSLPTVKFLNLKG